MSTPRLNSYFGDHQNTSGTISSDGDNQLLVLMFITGRSYAADGNDTISVGSVTSSGVTWTRVIHQTGFKINNDPYYYDSSFPWGVFSIDVFTAPAPTQVTSLAFTGNLTGDATLNNSTVHGYAVDGLYDITHPFDPAEPAGNYAQNVTGVDSAITVSGINTTNANSLIVTQMMTHFDGGRDFSVSGWTTTIEQKSNGDQTTKIDSALTYTTFTSPQSGLTYTAPGATDHYWNAATLVFTADSSAPVFSKSFGTVIT